MIEQEGILDPNLSMIKKNIFMTSDPIIIAKFTVTA